MKNRSSDIYREESRILGGEPRRKIRKLITEILKEPKIIDAVTIRQIKHDVKTFRGIVASMTPVAQVLREMGIPHCEFAHPGQIQSLEQAAAERGQSPEQVVRSIVFRVRAGEFVMVLMAGMAQISWPKLRQYLGLSRISLATEAEVLEVTGFRIGTVAPLGTASRLRVLADAGVFVHEEVSMGSGVPNIGIILKSADLRRALGDVEVGNFCSETITFP